MKVSQKKADDGKINLEVSATSDEVNKALQAAQIAFADSMGLTPQKDKTPAQAAEEQLGIKNLDSVVESSAIDGLVPLALDKRNIIPLFPPKAEPKTPFKRDRSFSFTMTVTPKPEYELTSYDPVEITVSPYEFDEKEVDQQIADLAQRYTTYVTADPKPVEKGDSCLLSMECYENGEISKNLTTDSRTYVAGEGYMPEGFDEEILGMQPGETKSFTFEGPGLDDDYNEIMQEIDCTVTVKEIQKPVDPVINDEWVATNMPMYDSLDALRDNIRSGLEKQDREAYESYRMQLAASELAKRFEGSIDDEAYEATRASLLNDMRVNLQQQGKSWDDFLEENGGEQQVGMMLMLQTREVLVQGFSLDAVFRHEHLTLSDQDILDACRAMNPRANPQQTRNQFEQSGRGFVLRETAERMKANKWVLEHAIVTIAESQSQSGDESEPKSASSSEDADTSPAASEQESDGSSPQSSSDAT